MMKMLATRRLRMQIWIACFAILFNALAPSLSYAISAMQGSPHAWVEICSVDGTKLVSPTADTAPDGAPAQDSSLHKDAHCPFCMVHADTWAPPPATTVALALIGGHDAFPSLFYRSPQPLFAWASANPRAPPVVS